MASPPHMLPLPSPRRPSMVASPLRIAALCLTSIAAMVPWPLLGALLLRSQFDRDSEAFLFFGGITLFPLMILALFSVAEWVLVVLIMLVWSAAALLPVVLLRRRLTTWTRIGILLGAQSAFSMAQAVMGALLVFGKSV